MKKFKKIFLIIIILILILIIAAMSYVIYNMSPVNNDDKTYKEVIVSSGMGRREIADLLYEEKIIKNADFFYHYMKIKKADLIYAASYSFSPSMKASEVLKTLLDGGKNTNTVMITFKEGVNMRSIANTIAEKTNNTYDDVMNKIKDEDYLNYLIEKYWFITDEIKNSDIYYSLEGYLFPDTYEFASADVSVEEIFEVMLDKMDDVLSGYKKQIEKSKYNIHELLTLASVTQLEGFTSQDFKNIASTFYNRLDSGMSLGSCVTSYYGVKKDMTSELYQSEIDAVNPYNTRSGKMDGKLPVGPLGSPSSDAIDAVMNPVKTDYYYFVSDKNNKLYFNKTYEQHEQTISELQNKGLWYEW